MHKRGLAMYAYPEPSPADHSVLLPNKRGRLILAIINWALKAALLQTR